MVGLKAIPIFLSKVFKVFPMIPMISFYQSNPKLATNYEIIRYKISNKFLLRIDEFEKNSIKFLKFNFESK